MSVRIDYPTKNGLDLVIATAVEPTEKVGDLLNTARGLPAAIVCAPFKK